MKVAVVTPTIGTVCLEKCLSSVKNQTYKNISHYVFVDGKNYFDRTKKVLSNFDTVNTFLDQNTGSNGWLGHRIYASCSYLIEADLICYLDEDNWIDPEHVELMIKEIDKGFDWCFSLRKIYSKDAIYLCNDDCESLGKWPVYVSSTNFHIDTSCYMVKTDSAKMVGHSWCKQLNADRYFFLAMKNNFPNFSCTGAYSLCYRLGSTNNSVQENFFKKGNSLYKEKFSNNFPWAKKF